jgi:hypothetical protein
VAVNCCVEPAAMLGAVGAMASEVTVAVDATTVRVAVALTPPSEAVMVALPAATPVVIPAELTVAVALL